MDDLRERAERLYRTAQHSYGFSDAVFDREITKMLDPAWQVHLFAAIEGALGVPNFFSTPKSILEAGCGSGAFVTAALARGHDAWGVDLDSDRLAIGKARIDAFASPSEWKSRLQHGDASNTPFASNSFDVVLGHQFIEHVPDPGGTLAELLRVTKSGGVVVLFAPDYRAPFEAHYEIPWPPFLSRHLCEAWLDGFDRPHGGLGDFFYATAPQVIAIFESLNCRITNAYNDREIERQVWRHFDCTTVEATRETARRFKRAFEARALPANFMAPTSFGIVAQKL
ncbi:MAG: class I SAM-dependent methyltransferase [Candidatus Eremiobacteraeota bacterium]|nr:class I SAM-dependent methyltransferase [Candidatus Eremiobacteraeota bacterium]